MRTLDGTIFTLRPYERGIQRTLGKYSRFVMPGFGIQLPLVHITRVRDNAKIVITEHGISPTLLLGGLPVEVATGSGNGKGVKVVRGE